VFILTILYGAFRPRRPENRILLRYTLEVRASAYATDLRGASLRACDFLVSLIVFGRKAEESICQQASPGFPRLRSGQALRLRAVNPSLYDGSARRFAQDDGFVAGLDEKHPK
jgi:hypothetical protein